MENDPFLNNTNTQPPQSELMPPPAGKPLYEWELGDLPLDPTEILQAEALQQPEDIDNLLPADAGAIDMAPIGKAVDGLRVSYHGLRFSLSRVREQRARERVAKLTRKDSMYASLRDASTDKSVSPQPTTNTTERVMDARQTKKTRKAQEKELRVLREQKVHGSSDVNTKATKAGRHTGTALRQARGQITAAQARSERLQTSALPSGKSQRYLRQMEREHGKADVKSRQPIAKRWRSFRRLNAEDTIAKQQRRAQEHLQKAIDIKNS